MICTYRTTSKKRLGKGSKAGIDVDGLKRKKKTKGSTNSSNITIIKIPQSYWDDLFEDALKAVSAATFEEFFESNEMTGQSLEAQRY